jgi:NADH-quinone oxidoreductase subunit H
MVSYEVALGLSVLPILLLAGNVSFSSVIAEQQAGLWYVLPLFLSFFVFLISGLAETNRLPFDMPEAESELIAGYHTEYSAMKFAMFFIAEYANMITVSAMTATLFLGGWDIPFTTWDQQAGVAQTLATGGFFVAKVMVFIFVFMWIRWTLPRFRYDQLMALGWKFLIEVATVYFVVIAIAVHLIGRVWGVTDPRAMGLWLFGLNLVLCYVVFMLLDRGIVIEGSSPQRRPMPPEALESEWR